MYGHLKPGGWYEQVEMAVRIPSDDDTVGPDHVLTKWGDTFEAAGEKLGKTFKIWEQSAAGVKKAGFQNVKEEKFKMPVGPWARDPKLKEIGRWNQLHCEEGIEGWAVALLTRVMGWTLEEVNVLLPRCELR
ncbi:MAG: hypothetical protein M1839_008641 [Geoglossum umbratile]|nr:MAG: hypothetical protein M1839_008641 [Geoglossum umbratile]